MATKQTTRTEEVTMIDDNSPGIVAYRVSQLEKTQKEGFLALNDKLEGIVQGFVTEKEMADAKVAAAEKHADMERRLTKLEGWNVWVTRIVLGAVVLGVLALLFSQNVVT